MKPPCILASDHTATIESCILDASTLSANVRANVQILIMATVGSNGVQPPGRKTWVIPIPLFSNRAYS